MIPTPKKEELINTDEIVIAVDFMIPTPKKEELINTIFYNEGGLT